MTRCRSCPLLTWASGCVCVWGGGLGWDVFGVVGGGACGRMREDGSACRAVLGCAPRAHSQTQMRSHNLKNLGLWSLSLAGSRTLTNS